MYSVEQIRDFKTWSKRRKVDELLKMDCAQYTNLGIDSTKEEKNNVKKNSKRIYRVIKEIDKEIGERLLSSIDQ
jgi:hypothetical protein